MTKLTLKLLRIVAIFLAFTIWIRTYINYKSQAEETIEGLSAHIAAANVIRSLNPLTFLPQKQLEVRLLDVQRGYVLGEKDPLQPLLLKEGEQSPCVDMKVRKVGNKPLISRVFGSWSQSDALKRVEKKEETNERKFSSIIQSSDEIREQLRKETPNELCEQ